MRPRALALFSQLETNLDYLETHIIPPTQVDVTGDDGVVYRWFPRHGPRVPSARGVLRAERRARAGPERRAATRARRSAASRAARRLVWEYSFRFGCGRPPWASGMAQAVAAQALARAGGCSGPDAARRAATRVRRCRR